MPSRLELLERQVVFLQQQLAALAARQPHYLSAPFVSPTPPTTNQVPLFDGDRLKFAPTSLAIGTGLTAPAAGYPVDVAATEADGTSTRAARDDHRHAHASGYLSDAHHAQLHQAAHNNAGGDALKLDDLATPDDNTDLNSATTRHGLLQKLPGGTTTFLRGDGTFAAPVGEEVTTQSQEFTASGTWTRPAGVTLVYVTLISGAGGGGGGGGGGNAAGEEGGGGGGGESGEMFYRVPRIVSADVTVTIGAGGTAGTAGAAGANATAGGNGGAGGATSFGSLSAPGGLGGTGAAAAAAGLPGTGGAGAAGLSVATAPSLRVIGGMSGGIGGDGDNGSSNAGSSSDIFAGGTGGTSAAGRGGGGGGGGGGHNGAGGNGGNGGNAGAGAAGTAAAANTGAGGGGGGGGDINFGGGVGAAGGSGYVLVEWVA